MMFQTIILLICILPARGFSAFVSRGALVQQNNNQEASTALSYKSNRHHDEPQVYKHLFRHYGDISFDSWLRCEDPMTFLESVGYSQDEIHDMAAKYPTLLTLNVHDQLAPKVRFLIETMGGGMGHMTWHHDHQDKVATHNLSDEECGLPPLDDHDDGASSSQHSMRLFEFTKPAVPPSFFGCQLNKMVGPNHAYLEHYGLPHGVDLLSHPTLFNLFLQACEDKSLEEFAALCQEWSHKNNHDHDEEGINKSHFDTPEYLHSVETVKTFHNDFAAGLLPASKQQESSPWMIPLLVSHGYNPFEYDSHGIGPLFYAAGTGNQQGVKAIITALQREENEDSSSIIDIIRNNREPKNGATPFHWACCGMSKDFIGERGSLDVCRWMIQEAKEDSQDLANLSTWTSQSTPLMYASWAGNMDLVELLIAEGADIEGINCRGETALHWAASAGHLDVCQYLLDKDNSLEMLEQVDETGRSPLDCAKQFRRTATRDWMIAAISAKETLFYLY